MKAPDSEPVVRVPTVNEGVGGSSLGSSRVWQSTVVGSGGSRGAARREEQPPCDKSSCPPVAHDPYPQTCTLVVVVLVRPRTPAAGPPPPCWGGGGSLFILGEDAASCGYSRRPFRDDGVGAVSAWPRGDPRGLSRRTAPLSSCARDIGAAHRRPSWN